ncbi:MAG: superinfection immunity protein [Elusimicrobia bacterium]|nr:superinfection immunity protein [Elusimicrobiota bacterium]
MLSIVSVIAVFIASIIGLIIYFIPSIVAFKRNAYSRWGIFFINLLFGWTLLIWLVTLIWACEGRK